MDPVLGDLSFLTDDDLLTHYPGRLMFLRVFKARLMPCLTASSKLLVEEALSSEILATDMGNLLSVGWGEKWKGCDLDIWLSKFHYTIISNLLFTGDKLPPEN